MGVGILLKRTIGFYHKEVELMLVDYMEVDIL